MQSVKQILTRRGAIALFDLSIAFFSLPIAAWLRGNFELAAVNQAVVTGAFAMGFIAALLYWLMGLHRGMWRYASSANLFYIARWLTISILVFVPIMFWIDRLNHIPRSLFVIQWFMALIGLWGARIAYVCFFRPEDVTLGRLDTDHTKPVLLIGGGDSAALVIQMMAQNIVPGYHAVGIVDSEARIGRTLHGVPFLGSFEQLRAIKHHLGAQGIEVQSLVQTRYPKDNEIEQFARLRADAQSEQMEIENAPELLVREYGKRTVSKTAQANANPERAAYEFLQRCFDICAVAVMFILTAPLMMIIAIAIRGFIDKHVMFNQFRPGVNRKPIWIHKFCTMQPPTDQTGHLLSDEQRISRLGAIFRRSRLDELPQMWNIIKGDMSLIGPRPLLVRDLPQASKSQMDLRYSVRPGITGWAQVNGGNHLTPEQKLDLDLWYIQHRSILLDLKIMVLTVRMMLFGERVNSDAVAMAQNMSKKLKFSADSKPLAST